MQNVPLDRVPLAGSTSLKGRQADSYKYQSGRRRTANSEASPNQEPCRTALYSPAEVDAQRAAPRKESRTIGSGAFLVTFAAGQK